MYLSLLDTANPIQMYALHYVYLPRINKAIHAFKNGWNSYRIRTEHNKSPHQLFAEGALRLQRAGLVSLDFFDNVEELYGSEDDFSVIPDSGLDTASRVEAS